MPYVATKDGAKIHYKDWGSGPPIVLVHGWPLNADMWESQAVFLAEQGFRVISYDRRGFGRSDQPWTGYDYDTLTDDLAALIDRLELSAVTLVGFSMGGGEVARYLGRGAPKASRGALISAVTPLPFEDGRPSGGRGCIRVRGDDDGHPQGSSAIFHRPGAKFLWRHPVGAACLGSGSCAGTSQWLYPLRPRRHWSACEPSHRLTFEPTCHLSRSRCS